MSNALESILNIPTLIDISMIRVSVVQLTATEYFFIYVGHSARKGRKLCAESSLYLV